MPSRTTILSICLAAALLTAMVATGFVGGEWYALLLKPAWGPPRWLLALAWPLFYLGMALAAAGAWQRARVQAIPGAAVFMLAWLATLVLIIGWHALLLDLHRPGWALAELSLALAASVFTLVRVPVPGTPARALLTACMAWLFYLWVWNLAVWRMNGGGVDSILG